MRCFCPEGGDYQLLDDGDVECSIHGSRLRPQQAAEPSPNSSQGRAVLDLQDLQVSLKFLEDGLHAIVTIERK